MSELLARICFIEDRMIDKYFTIQLSLSFLSLLLSLLILLFLSRPLHCPAGSIVVNYQGPEYCAKVSESYLYVAAKCMKVYLIQTTRYLEVQGTL